MTDAQTRIVFTGDIVFSGYFSDGWSGKGCLSGEVLEYLKQADHVVGNVECPLTNEPIHSNRQFNLAGSPEAGRYLYDINIRNWNLANNHIMDCGSQGLLDTIETAHACGCQTVGAGENEDAAAVPLILGDEVKVGILSVAQGWRHIKSDKDKAGAQTVDKEKLISNTITELQKKTDWIVAISHAGDEFSDMPMPYTRDRYIKLLDMGVDVVIGHHPHVIQNYEYVGKKLIVYSLGNFIFDSDRQRKFEHTDAGMLVGLDFRSDGFALDGLPVRINRRDHFVEKGAVPAVFHGIGADDYRLLWPLAARKLFKIDLHKKRLYNNRKALYKRKAYVFVRYLRVSIVDFKERTIQKGRLLSLFRKSKKAELRDVVDYLRN